MKRLAFKTVVISLLLASAFSAQSADIGAVDIWQDFDFTTLDATNLAAHDHGSFGTWLTVVNPESKLATSASGEKISTGLIDGESDSGGTRGMSLTAPDPVSDTHIALSFPNDSSCSYGFWYQFPASMVGSDDEQDILNVLNALGANELYIKQTDHTGRGSHLYLYTGESGYSSAISIGGSPGTWFWITAQHNTGGAGSPHKLRVYDSTGAQVGSEQTRPSHATEQPDEVDFGSTSAGTLVGHSDSHYYDDFVIDCTNSTFPLGPPIATGSSDHEGFRWGVDDGSESAHTFEAAQDTNISIADNQSRLLRTLVDTTTGDLSSAAYTLRYQKNGSGGYVAVPVGSTSKVTPVIETGDATQSGNDTASSSWTTVAYPNASTGDLLIACLSWDDSTNTTAVTAPSGPNGETFTAINSTPATDASTETRSKCWYTKATGSWTAGNLTFTPNASEQWTGAVIRVPTGEFDATTPIGASGTNAATGTAETNVQHGAFSAGASDGGGKLAVWTSADADPQTVAANFTQVANTDRGAESGGFFTRDTAVTNSESFSATTVSTINSDSWTSVAFVVRAPTVSNEVYITTSANITASGEATTARLTAPSGKTTSDFLAGRRWDDENGTDSTDITAADYSEFEWLVFVASSANPADFFDFRTYKGVAPLDTYALTPRWTIPGGSGGLLLRRRRMAFLPMDFDVTAVNDEQFYLRKVVGF